MGHPIGERQRWAWLAAAASAVTAACLCGLSWLSVLLGAAVACGLWLALDAALRTGYIRHLIAPERVAAKLL